MKPSGTVRAAVVGTIVLAGTSTLADAFWAAALSEHRAIYGLVHGGAVLGILGLTLAWLVGGERLWHAGLLSVGIGVAAAGVFYALYPLIGVAAMLVAWMALWLAYAWLTDRFAADPEGGSLRWLRGLAGAVLSGIGFWSISGIWLGSHDPGVLYWRNFAAWCVAFAPGFLALLGGRTPR